jgi:hypothetical protein
MKTFGRNASLGGRVVASLVKFSEWNVSFLRERETRHIVGTSKSRLSTSAEELALKENWMAVENDVETRCTPPLPQDVQDDC